MADLKTSIRIEEQDRSQSRAVRSSRKSVRTSRNSNIITHMIPKERNSTPPRIMAIPRRPPNGDTIIQPMSGQMMIHFPFSNRPMTSPRSGVSSGDHDGGNASTSSPPRSAIAQMMSRFLTPRS